jgi:DNA recombination protein RmuC
MNDALLPLLALILGLAIGYAICYYLMVKAKSIQASQEADRLRQDLQESRNKREADQQTIAQNQGEIARVTTQLKEAEVRLQEQKSEIELLHKQLTEKFELIANRIVSQNSKSMQERHEEKLKDILNPFKERIEKFEKQVDTTHKESIKDHQSLKSQIAQLQELNKTIGIEAQNLTKALKGEQKTQGNWGEFILESILEKSGLEKGREFVVQESVTNTDGKRLQPDVVIKLPEGKTLVIDSKVSLTAYERYINEEDESQKALHLKAHLQSLKNHVKQLSDKNYNKLYDLKSLDFVLMFVPIEPAFNVAVQADPKLYNDSFHQNIIIISTSTLLATLRTISSIWRQEKQNLNAVEIAKEGGLLYDKFTGFVETLIGLGKKMESAKSDYEKAMGQLHLGKGNLVRRAEKMKALGIKTSKNLPDELVDRAE